MYHDCRAEVRFVTCTRCPQVWLIWSVKMRCSILAGNQKSARYKRRVRVCVLVNVLVCLSVHPKLPHSFD